MIMLYRSEEGQEIKPGINIGWGSGLVITLMYTNYKNRYALRFSYSKCTRKFNLQKRKWTLKDDIKNDILQKGLLTREYHFADREQLAKDLQTNCERVDMLKQENYELKQAQKGIVTPKAVFDRVIEEQLENGSLSLPDHMMPEHLRQKRIN